MPDLPATAQSAPALDQGLLDELQSAVRRHLTIESVCAAGGRADSVRIGRVEVGDASIDRVTIEDFSSHVRCGAALLRNIRAILEIHFDVRWSYDLKWFGSDQGVKALGSKAKTIPIHDLRVPMLQDIGLEIPSAEVADAAASVQPITDLALGGAGFTDLEIADARLTRDGFRLSGLGFRSLDIARFAAEDAESASLRIASFAPDAPLRLPDVAVGSIGLPAVEIPDVGSPEPISLMDIETEAFEAPVFKIGDLFKAVFVATPVLHLQIGELVLSELTATASIGAVQVEGITTPVSVEGVQLGGLALDGIAAERISI